MNPRMLGALGAVALLAACANKEAATTAGAGAAPMSAGPTPGSQEDLVKNVGDRVFFGFNQATLEPDARGTLDKQAGWLGQYQQVQVQVAGNADPRGTEEYNLALGQRRANSARDYLVAKGTASARISTISYGKENATGNDDASWAQDRNAVTSVK